MILLINKLVGFFAQKLQNTIKCLVKYCIQYRLIIINTHTQPFRSVGQKKKTNAKYSHQDACKQLQVLSLQSERIHTNRYVVYEVRTQSENCMHSSSNTSFFGCNPQLYYRPKTNCYQSQPMQQQLQLKNIRKKVKIQISIPSHMQVEAQPQKYGLIPSSIQNAFQVGGNQTVGKPFVSKQMLLSLLQVLQTQLSIGTGTGLPEGSAITMESDQGVRIPER
eukprot:TRINITY_DN9535_c3_g1_i3.p4 TRINITY_DN9535_c3_g1~~TRINITY_DN9535_c3_g1_i3.p4  ORF type:complete len:221 (-),score=-0.64 TRINITY_DN9535_c3_g1_i3:23-685(-)